MYNFTKIQCIMDITNLILKDFAENGFYDAKIAEIRDIIKRLTDYTKEGITVIGPIVAIPKNNGTYILKDLRQGFGYRPLDLEYEGELTEDSIKTFLKRTVYNYRDSADQIDQIIKDFYKD